MTVFELKVLLTKYPNDMEILFSQYSDYKRMEADDICTTTAVMKDGWAMRPHETMSPANKAEEKTYLLFPGN